jgi:hypothetical protein
MSHLYVLIAKYRVNVIEVSRRYKFDFVSRVAENYCYSRLEEGVGLTRRKGEYSELTEDGERLLLSLGVSVYFADCWLGRNISDLQMIHELLQKIKMKNFLVLPASFGVVLKVGDVYLINGLGR